MGFRTVAIFSAGDMGHAMGSVLVAGGRRVVTVLEGRSALTQERARRAGIEDVGELERAVHEADALLSIMPPGAAEAFAERCAQVAPGRRQAEALVFADCNAVSPRTARRMDSALRDADVAFVDGGLVGAPPGRGPTPTRLYLSGSDAARLARIGVPLPGTRAENEADGDREASFEVPSFEVRVVGSEIGQASGLKMVYAGLTKGTMTLHAAVLMAAWRLGLYDELSRELQESQAHAWSRMGVLPFLPADAGRWIGEMEEIAATFGDVGAPTGFHDAAAEIFRVMAGTPFAEESRETLDRTRNLEDAIAAFADLLPD